MLNTQEVQVWREPGGDYLVEWQASQPGTEVLIAALHEGRVLREHSARGARGSARIAGLPPGRRHMFEIADQHGNSVRASERRLGMEGAVNFRDFGGYHTRDGQRLRWGYLYRSGQLSRLSERDLELLQSLQLDLVCDFRREEEQRNDPNRLPAESQPALASLPIIPGSNRDALAHSHFEEGGREAMYAFMVGINRDFALAQAPTYARMFREILQRPQARFLVQCAAGKDRTGFAVALILLALGVPEQTVMRDYLLTARFFKPADELARVRRKYGMDSLEAEAIWPMLEVHKDYLATALTAMVDKCGSVENYLREALGVGAAERSELRHRYLEG